MVVSVLFLIGGYDEGFDWLERSYARRKPSIVEIKNEDSLDGVHTDPRYLDMLKRLRLD